MIACAQCGKQFEPKPAAPSDLCPECSEAVRGQFTLHAKVAPLFAWLRKWSPQVPWMTLLLASAIIAVYVVLPQPTLQDHLPQQMSRIEDLLRPPPSNGALILQGQWWRLLSSMFMHGIAVDLIGNLVLFLPLGWLAERIYGRAGLFWLFILSGLAGGIGSLLLAPFWYGIGSSDAIAGILGALLSTLIWRHPAGITARARRIFLFFPVAAALFVFLAPAILFRTIHIGHISGFLAGLLLGLAFPFNRWRAARSPTRDSAAIDENAVSAVTSFEKLAATSPEHQRRLLGVVAGSLAVLALGAGIAWASHRTLIQLDYVSRLSASDPDLAITKLEEILAGKPNLARAHWLLGEALQRKGRFEDAVAEYKRALQLAPGSADQHETLGLVLKKQERIDEAIAELQKAVALAPDPKVSLETLGVMYLEAKRYDDAIGALEGAVHIPPIDKYSFIELIRAYEEAERFDEAIGACKRFLDFYPAEDWARDKIDELQAEKAQLPSHDK